SIRSRLGNTAAAEEADRQALGILNGLVSDHSAVPAYRDALAQAHRELGAVLGTEARWIESERELKEAAALWAALARGQPEVARYRSRLADAHGSLGDLYRLQARFGEAGAAFRRALDVADRLARENPEVDAYQESLARILGTYGRVQCGLTDLTGSEASL